MEPKWLPNPPEDDLRSFHESSRKTIKNDFETGAKREPKWRPKGIQSRGKTVATNEVDHWRGLGTPLDRFWDDLEATLTIFLTIVCVPPVRLLRVVRENTYFPMCLLRFDFGLLIFLKGQLAHFLVSVSLGTGQREKNKGYVTTI